MRQYQPIWEQIKKTGAATLVAPLASHRRIIQAVRKERSNDRGWRLLTYEAKLRYTLDISTLVHKNSEVGTLSFKLEGIYDASLITLSDL